MTQKLALVSFLVPTYGEGIEFFTTILGWDLVEDTDLGDTKRWVRVAPKSGGQTLLLAEAKGDQSAYIGKQGGGRVWLFLETDDFARDYDNLQQNGITFEQPPRFEDYGIVAVFRDPFGNRWDLIERKLDTPALDIER